MSGPEPDAVDIDGQLEELIRKAYQANDECRTLTVSRIAKEVRRLARAEQRLYPYLVANHILTNSAGDLLDPELGKEASVEMIAVLESEERARQVQPGYDENLYERLITQLSSCAYDNLAKATAMESGYNSQGLHSGIAEGIQICRRTGKLECINCFREYAVSVHRAADDFEMALHHARTVAQHGNTRPGFDRRWSGADEEGKLLLLSGQLEAAEAAALRALELCPSFHNPLGARLSTLDTLETARLLLGTLDPSEPSPADAEAAGIEAGEFPGNELRHDLREALRASLRGDQDAAIRILTPWDRRLQEQNCRDRWFDVRLQIVAAQRLAGRPEKVAALAGPLEVRAREGRDWLTLRRLSRLLDPKEPASPLAAAGPLTSGPFGTSAGVAPVPAPRAEDPEAEPVAEEPTPLAPALHAIVERMGDLSNDPATWSAALDRALAVPPGSVTHPDDAAQLVHMVHFLCRAAPERGPEIWRWAEEVAAPFGQDAVVLNLLADLGDTLREAPGLDAVIDAGRIEAMFRRSLDLDPEKAGNHARAGIFFLAAGDVGEAERCLARSFRLDRSRAEVALRLAELYARTDRTRDALAVLDMALREGCEEPQVALRAAVLAHGLDQHEATLTYLDRFESMQPGEPWAEYYRASSLLALGRPEEARAALAEERRRNETGTLHLEILEACAASDLGDLDALREHLRHVLAVPLSDVDYLTFEGLTRLFARLWGAGLALPEGDPLRTELEHRLLVTGLAPNEMFECARRARPKAEGLSFYTVGVLQPLDASWAESPGCLPGQDDWIAYRIAWGVLATDEEDARREVLDWQGRCEPQEAEVERVELQEEGYTDSPGVVWQGYRAGVEEEDAEADPES